MVYFILFSYYLLTLTLQYWGWAKHRYRDVYKTRFDQAKKTARECLDACPEDVIRRFFNHSWCFIDAYCHRWTRGCPGGELGPTSCGRRCTGEGGIVGCHLGRWINCLHLGPLCLMPPRLFELPRPNPLALFQRVTACVCAPNIDPDLVAVSSLVDVRRP